MTRIFISHSSDDNEFCKKLAASLAELGADTFLDVEDIRAGEDWGESIQQGLDSSGLMLLVISPKAMQSRHVGDEWKYYFDRNKPIIPILWKPAERPFQISRLQYIDFQKQDYDQALRQLHTELARKGIRLNPLPQSPPALPSQKVASTRSRPKPSRGLLILGVVALLIFGGIGAALLLGGGDGDKDEPEAGNQTDEPIEVAESNPTATDGPTPTPSSTPTPTATPEASVAQADFALSGKVAFQRSDGSRTFVEVVDLANPEAGPVRLTPPGAQDSSPLISPDGQWVALTRRLDADGATTFGVSDVQGRDFLAAPPDSFLESGDTLTALGWSANSRLVFFSATNPSASGTWSDFYVFDTQSEKLGWMSGGVGPFAWDWSDQGQTLAFFTPQNASDPARVVIGERDAVGFAETFVQDDLVRDVLWASLERNSILYLANTRRGDDTEQSFYRVGWDGGDSGSVTEESGDFESPALSPDGQYVTYQQAFANGSSTLVLAALGDEEMTLVSEYGPLNTQLTGKLPIWSPDATHLAFYGQAGSDSTVTYYVMDRATQTIREVGRGSVGTFRWSADGQTFLFKKATGSGGTRYFTASLRSPTEHYIVDGLPEAATSLSWQRDPRPVVVAAAEPEPVTPSGQLFYQVNTADPGEVVNLAWMDVAAALPQPLSSDSAPLTNQPQWSPNGRYVAFTAVGQDDSTVGLFIANSDGPQAVFDSETGSVGKFAWSPDGLYLAYEVHYDGETALEAYYVGLKDNFEIDQVEQIGNYAFAWTLPYNVGSQKLDYTFATGADVMYWDTSARVSINFMPREPSPTTALFYRDDGVAFTMIQNDPNVELLNITFNPSIDPKIDLEGSASFILPAPNGRYVAHITAESGDLWITATEGSATFEVDATLAPIDEATVIWSPNSQYAAFVGLQDDLAHWMYVDISTREIQTIAPFGSDQNPAGQLVWSPDSQSLAYVGLDDQGQADLYLATRGGDSPPVQLTDSAEVESHLAWGPSPN